MDFKISMRRTRWIIIMLLIAITSKSLHAQGNLQFNQVHTFGEAFIPISPFDTYYYTPEHVVPPNKVWKIEARTNVAGQGGAFQFLVNETPVELVSDCVIWLKQGDTIKYRRYSTFNNINFVFISILEFNIVP
jgi:hypothetical protein